MRVITAAIVGGLIVFVWSAVAHMATPLGMAGLSVVPNEDPLMQSMRSALPQSGLYFFPKPTSDDKEWAAKLAAGPSGLIVYTAGGTAAMNPSQLIGELLTNVACAAIGAFLLTNMVGTYMRRSLAVTLLALFASLSISMSYVIWYHFPLTFFMAELITEIVGWFLAGLAMAKMIKPITLVTSDVAPGT